MDNYNLKRICTEYLLHKLIEWKGGPKKAGLIIRRINFTKIVFYLCLMDRTKYNTNSLCMFKIFDNWRVGRLGPIEYDLYKIIIHPEFKSIKVIDYKEAEERELSWKGEFEYLKPFDEDLPDKYKTVLDNAVNKLKSLNPNIINYSIDVLVHWICAWWPYKVQDEIAVILHRNDERLRYEGDMLDPKYKITYYQKWVDEYENKSLAEQLRYDIYLDEAILARLNWWDKKMR